jgi:hypothetical protein
MRISQTSLCDEGVKSTLDSCEAQGPFWGIQNLQNCDQILILGNHLERKRAAGAPGSGTWFIFSVFTRQYSVSALISE